MLSSDKVGSAQCGSNLVTVSPQSVIWTRGEFSIMGFPIYGRRMMELLASLLDIGSKMRGRFSAKSWIRLAAGLRDKNSTHNVYL